MTSEEEKVEILSEFIKTKEFKSTKNNKCEMIKAGFMDNICIYTLKRDIFPFKTRDNLSKNLSNVLHKEYPENKFNVLLCWENMIRIEIFGEEFYKILDLNN